MRIAYTDGWDSSKYPDDCSTCKFITTYVGIYFSCRKKGELETNKCDSWEPMPNFKKISLWERFRTWGNRMIITDPEDVDNDK